MNLSSLVPTTKRKKKRVGRGYGSGKGGHTVGRGQKGQKSRSGGKAKKERDYGKKRGFTPPISHSPRILNVSKLAVFADGEEVNPQTLLEKGLIKKIPRDGVKILGKGKLEKKLVLKGLSVSAGVKGKIEKAGGEVLNVKIPNPKSQQNLKSK